MGTRVRLVKRTRREWSVDNWIISWRSLILGLLGVFKDGSISVRQRLYGQPGVVEFHFERHNV